MNASYRTCCLLNSARPKTLLDHVSMLCQCPAVSAAAGACYHHSTHFHLHALHNVATVLESTKLHMLRSDEMVVCRDENVALHDKLHILSSRIQLTRAMKHDWYTCATQRGIPPLSSAETLHMFICSLYAAGMLSKQLSA